MAETFTSDNSTESEVLTEEEQDSLAVGEQLTEAQDKLLAGKYKNAEDLEAAYLSLQQKLGKEEEVDYESSDEGYEEEEGADEEVSENAPAISLINEASDEYYANDGTLSEETISKFSEMSSQDLVEAYMEMYESGQVGQASQGVEISAPAGTPVQAIHTGEVVFSDWLRGFGLLLIVDHGNNYMSLYGNAEALLKTKGDQVESGELIAEAGNSGARKESGIYFEIRHRGQPIDPEPWFASK